MKVEGQCENRYNCRASFLIPHPSSFILDRLARYTAEQSLQILPFGKIKRDRVIGRSAQTLNDLGLDAGIQCGAAGGRLKRRPSRKT